MNSFRRYEKCIEATAHCAAVCLHAASMGAKEKREDVSHCVQVCLECAEICRLTGAMMSQGSKFSSRLVQLCINCCEECANACRKHTFAYCQEAYEASTFCADELEGCRG